MRKSEAAEIILTFSLSAPKPAGPNRGPKPTDDMGLTYWRLVVQSWNRTLRVHSQLPLSKCKEPQNAFSPKSRRERDGIRGIAICLK